MSLDFTKSGREPEAIDASGVILSMAVNSILTPIDQIRRKITRLPILTSLNLTRPAWEQTRDLPSHLITHVSPRH